LRQALISFSIGPYCDEVLFDILPMDACHLLLGMPWLFDNHVIYGRHANTYTFKHNGKGLTLDPLPPPDPHKVKLGKESEKIPTRVKHGKSAPLVRVSLEFPY